MATDFDKLFHDREQLDALATRFRARLQPSGDCMVWTGACTPKGYGLIGYGPKVSHATIYTHRLAYWLSNGRDPGAALVMHSCDNPSCCNPDHLSLGTYGDNTNDMVSKGRQSRGEGHYSAKLKDADIPAIRSDSRSLSAIASAYGVDIKQIHRIKRGDTWKHVA